MIELRPRHGVTRYSSFQNIVGSCHGMIPRQKRPFKMNSLIFLLRYFLEFLLPDAGFLTGKVAKVEYS